MGYVKFYVSNVAYDHTVLFIFFFFNFAFNVQGYFRNLNFLNILNSNT